MPNLWKVVVGITTTFSYLSSAEGRTTAAASSSASPQVTVPAFANDGQPVLPNIFDSQAVDVQAACPGYKISNVKRQPHGVSATLTLAGAPCNVYGDDVDELQLRVQYQAADRVHVEIEPTYIGPGNQTWFVPPESQLRKASIEADAASKAPLNDLEFAYGNSPSFWMKMIRKSNSEIIFDTSGTVLVFETQFVEFKTALPEEYNLYGLGETVHSLRLGNNFTKTMWNADGLDAIDRNIYGTHPVYYDTRYYDDNGAYVPWSHTTSNCNYTSFSHAVYYRNAHAHEILLRPEGLTWRTLGGNIDLYFYAGPTVEEAAKSFQCSTVGLPAMQQYWTFGYHHGRGNYTGWADLEENVANFEKFRIPLETQWNDITEMDQNRDFTNDPVRFDTQMGRQFLDRLHDSGRHYVHIADAGVYSPNPNNAADAYPPYTRGHEVDAFLHNPDGSEYLGVVWPGYTVFPDWLAEHTGSWWTDEMTRSHQNISFDGIWIDMSEASSFCVGSCGSGHLEDNPVVFVNGDVIPAGYPEGFKKTNASEASSIASISRSIASVQATAAPSITTTTHLRPTVTPGARNIDYPPYAINNVFFDLAKHAISPNATHRDALRTQEYDIHNVYAFGILKSTYDALLNIFPGKRPFIIGRGTSPGAGSVAGHWGGDNTSQWRHMYWSIPHALSMALFGIPMFGVDTCGYLGNTDEELCNRWMQLSAFFPFCKCRYRNYNNNNPVLQEPYLWESVITASKTAMQIRYSLLPYIYTLFHAAHTAGSTVMRALAWEFPNEPALVAADREFLLGPSLLVIPVLEPGAIAVQGVFPGVQHGEVWYDWYNQSRIVDQAALRGENVSIPAPLGHIPVFVRGGSVLPMQPLQDALTIREARKHAWTLLVGLDGCETAMGSLYMDDGESVHPAATLEVAMTVEAQTLHVRRIGAFDEPNPLTDVTVMGVRGEVKGVKLNEEAVKDFKYDVDSEVLVVMGLERVTRNGAWSQDWALSWW